MEDSCVDWVRKQREKGYKRGPYRKRSATSACLLTMEQIQQISHTIKNNQEQSAHENTQPRSATESIACGPDGLWNDLANVSVDSDNTLIQQKHFVNQPDFEPVKFDISAETGFKEQWQKLDSVGQHHRETKCTSIRSPCLQSEWLLDESQLIQLTPEDLDVFIKNNDKCEPENDDLIGSHDLIQAELTDLYDCFANASLKNGSLWDPGVESWGHEDDPYFQSPK
jgi:hypothetical protein